MKSVFAPVAAALLLAGNAAAQLMINTPSSAVVCQPLLITWSGGTPPYFLSILPGNQPSAAALLDFGTVTGTQLTWTVNITAGTSLGLDLRDQTGTLAQSAAFTVQASSNTACLTSSGSTTAVGSTTGTGTTTTPATTPVTTPVTTPATTAVTTTPAGTSTTPSTSKASTTVASSAPATSSTTSAAAPAAHVGLAGFLGVGAALAALLA